MTTITNTDPYWRMRITRHFYLWPGESMTYEDFITKSGPEYDSDAIDLMISKHPRLTKAG
jgi:hypothetical protein